MAPPRQPNQSVIYLDQAMAKPELLAVAHGTAAVFSARCPGKETPNEDAAAVIPLGPDAAVLAVADGAGGMRCGQDASRTAIAGITEALRDVSPSRDDARAAILEGIDHANDAILALGVGAATTLAIVEVNERVIRSYHVGDSDVLVVGNRGKVKLQTVSHSPVGFAVESGMLDEVEAMSHEHRHIVSNVLGTSEMRVEVGPPLPLAARDTLLLTTDGLSDNLNITQIIDRIRRGPIRRAARALAQDTHTQMCQPPSRGVSKPDDLTFILFRLSA